MILYYIKHGKGVETRENIRINKSTFGAQVKRSEGI